MMIFWAGLRGAVGVALALGIQGEAKWTLLATVLVVVVLTVIFFGGTTASMLEILGIKVGCVEENDSDDEFDIEAPRVALESTPSVNIMGSRRYENNPYANGNSSTNFRNTSNTSLPYIKNSSLLNSRNNSQPDLANDDDELNGSDVDDMLTTSNNLPGANSSSAAQVNNGILGAFLSAEEHAKWFTKFDEEVLKPVLLDKMPGQRGNDNNDGSPV